MEANGGTQLHRQRIAVVGDSGVGKTWTIRSLRGEANIQYETDTEYNQARTHVGAMCAIRIGDISIGGDETLVTRNHDDDGSRTGPTPASSDIDMSTLVALSSCFAFVLDSKIRHEGVFSDSHPPQLHLSDGELCYLSFWDFGGQAMYHSWYQFFFAPGMIPCVVFSLSKLQELAENESTLDECYGRIVELAQQAAHYGDEDGKVLLIGTGSDQTEGDVWEFANATLRRIEALSPEWLSDRFYLFTVHESGVTVPHKCRVCPVDNEKGRNDMGIKTLKSVLYRECLSRGHSISGQDAEGQSSGDCRLEDLMRQHVMPMNWFKFEKYMREDDEWCSKDWCLVSSLWNASKPLNEPAYFSSQNEFAALLWTLSSIGSIVLTMNLPKNSFSENYTLPIDFMDSVVILRPEWLLEIGCMLLPHPDDSEDRFIKRFPYGPVSEGVSVSLKKVHCKRLWNEALLYEPLFVWSLNLPPNDPNIDCIAHLFESRFILSRIKQESADNPTGRRQTTWFVPAMVVFHADKAVSNRELPMMPTRCSIHERHVAFELKLAWVPPGLPLLFTGAMMSVVSGLPRFWTYFGGAIRFKAELAGFQKPVYFDLTHGARGKDIVVWYGSGHTAESNVREMRTMAGRILSAVSLACVKLMIQPVLHSQVDILDRELLVEFKVPLVFCDIKAERGLTYSLYDVCRDLLAIPEGCNIEETKKLYRSLLKSLWGKGLFSFSYDLFGEGNPPAEGDVGSFNASSEGPLAVVKDEKWCLTDEAKSDIHRMDKCISSVSFDVNCAGDMTTEQLNEVCSELWAIGVHFVEFVIHINKFLLDKENVISGEKRTFCPDDWEFLQRVRRNGVRVFVQFVLAKRLYWENSREGESLEKKLWDAFLSHAGEEKSTYVGWLFEDVKQKMDSGTEVFFDEKALEIGDKPSKEMIYAVLTCRVAVTTISTNFVVKKWPLLELCLFSARETLRAESGVHPRGSDLDRVFYAPDADFFILPDLYDDKPEGFWTDCGWEVGVGWVDILKTFILPWNEMPTACRRSERLDADHAHWIVSNVDRLLKSSPDAHPEQHLLGIGDPFDEFFGNDGRRMEFARKLCENAQPDWKEILSEFPLSREHISGQTLLNRVYSFLSALANTSAQGQKQYPVCDVARSLMDAGFKQGLRAWCREEKNRQQQATTSAFGCGGVNTSQINLLQQTEAESKSKCLFGRCSIC